jgi:mRNA interferase HigB
MHVISRATLIKHYESPGRADSKGPLEAWFQEVKKARWHGPTDIKARYASADFVADNRVIFNIGGNKYRLIVRVRYATAETDGTIFVRFVGTHKEYDAIKAEEV